MPENRLLGADFLRAFACLMVMFHHLAFRLPLDRAPEAVRPFMSFLVMGSFGVSIFFVLSGVLLARPFWLALDAGKPMPSLRIYALRRAARILPGFWLALTVSLVVGVTLGGAVLDGQRLLRFFAGMLLVSDWHWVTLFPVDNNGPLWSIGFEVTAYLLLPLCLFALFVLRLRGVMARLAWLGVIALVLMAHWLIVQYAPIDDVDRGWDHGLVGGAKAWMPRYNPIGFFAIFATGALVSGLQTMLAGRRHLIFDLVGLASVATVCTIMAAHIGGLTEGFGFLDIPYAFPSMPLAVALALATLPGSVLVGRLLDNRVSRFLAEISFGIYIWHFLVIGLMARLLPPSFDRNAADPFLVWLGSSAAAVALSILIATLSFYLLERPLVRWARGLETGSAPRVAADQRAVPTRA